MEADSEDCEYILVDFGTSAAAAEAVAHAEQLVFEGLASEAPRAHFSTGAASFQGEFQHVIGTDMIFSAGPGQAQPPTHAHHPLSSRYCVRSFKTLVMSESLPAVNATSAESAPVPRGER